MDTFTLSRFPIQNKTVFLRVDYNIPCKEITIGNKRNQKIENKILDNSKIKASLPTIKYLLEQNCKLVVATHLGDPQGKFHPQLQTKFLAQELQKLLPHEKIISLNNCCGKEVHERILAGKQKHIFFLENLRFYPEEEQNDPAFAHALSSLADFYVNDAFAVCHRAHASVDAITNFLPSIPGILVEKELHYLSHALHPKRPAVWIMGGAKLDKVDLLEQALKKADYILVGGALAFSFWRAKKIPVGMSKVDSQSIKIAAKILSKKEAKKIILPLDFMVAEKISPLAKSTLRKYDDIRSSEIGLDLGPETVNLFKHYLRRAHTIVWNGPLGYFEYAQFAAATKEIGRYVSNLTAVSICGGGETAAAIRKFSLEHKITHLSTGGGAFLSFLAGKKLPGIAALEKNYQKYKKKY